MTRYWKKMVRILENDISKMLTFNIIINWIFQTTLQQQKNIPVVGFPPPQKLPCLLSVSSSPGFHTKVMFGLQLSRDSSTWSCHQCCQEGGWREGCWTHPGLGGVNWRDVWVVVAFKDFWNFHHYLRRWSNLTNIFQMGWNHQQGRDIYKIAITSILPPWSRWSTSISWTNS